MSGIELFSVHPIHFSEQAHVTLHENTLISDVKFTSLNILNRFFFLILILTGKN